MRGLFAGDCVGYSFRAKAQMDFIPGDVSEAEWEAALEHCSQLSYLVRMS